jgi:nucleotide-binding universal stress UspA family protein
VNRITRILVPTDFSDTSDTALTYARSLADSLGASLHLVHVFDDSYADAMLADASAAVYESMRATAMGTARRKLQRRMPPAERRRLFGTTSMIDGTPATAIVDYANEHDIDLIVMGTHGRRGFAHLLLGSVAEQVVRTAKCPVLTVRDKQAERVRDRVPEAAAAVA